MNEVDVNIEHDRISIHTVPKKNNKLEMIIIGALIVGLSVGAVIGCSGFYKDMGRLYSHFSGSYR